MCVGVGRVEMGEKEDSDHLETKNDDVIELSSLYKFIIDF